MAEWFKALVLKTCILKKYHGFESHFILIFIKNIMFQKVLINTALLNKIPIFSVKSTKLNKHFILKEIPATIFSFLYLILFVFFLFSMALLALTCIYEAWSTRVAHEKKMSFIHKYLLKKGFSYVERIWYLEKHVELTDWSECLFLQLPGIIWLLGTLWIIYGVLEQKERYARKIYVWVYRV